MAAHPLKNLIGYSFEPYYSTHSPRDVSLYALGVGAGQHPTDLPLVYELHQDGFLALPTFAVTLPFGLLNTLFDVPGLDFNPMNLLHGEHYLQLHHTFPTAGRLSHHAVISNIFDKEKAALLIINVETRTENNTPLCLNQFSVFIKGLGGFGGERGPASPQHHPPERPPDALEEETTLPTQALLYRLSGDRNPLHADPNFAALGGFEKPILHGLCTFGFAARAVLKHFAQNNPTRLHSITARFTAHVFPGETLITKMWHTPPNTITFQTHAAERNTLVLSRAAITLKPQP